MKTLMFRGYSDDTFMELTTKTDYDNCASGEPIRMIVGCPEGQLIVVGHYACSDTSEAVWMVGIEQCDEDKPIPEWPIRMRSEDYSPVLEIDVPDDFQVVVAAT